VRRVNPADGPPPYNNFYGHRSDFGSRFKAVTTESRANESGDGGGNAAHPARKRTRDDQTEQERGINIKRERLGPFSID
jgi:hypothetical protein